MLCSALLRCANTRAESSRAESPRAASPRAALLHVTSMSLQVHVQLKDIMWRIMWHRNVVAPLAMHVDVDVAMHDLLASVRGEGSGAERRPVVD